MSGLPGVSRRDAAILMRRLAGLHGKITLGTFEAIAARYGISRERVRRVCAVASSRMARARGGVGVGYNTLARDAYSNDARLIRLLLVEGRFSCTAPSLRALESMDV